MRIPIDVMLTKTLDFGCRKFSSHCSSTPALAVDERRQYLGAVLDKRSAIPRHE